MPCNNDLLAANFIDDGARLWVIDYEYGGNNDPCFELGNICAESTSSSPTSSSRRQLLRAAAAPQGGSGPACSG